MGDPNWEIVAVPVLSVIRETDGAILIETEEAEVWIPKALIKDSSDVNKEGDSGDLHITRGIAEEKDLYYEEL